ncbi:phospholipase A2 inhibitor and Ly6/PLAUR domain-containing protein-like [Hyperolius riggenbachi]|uniref:phospholipase A2 inhibitor and Ly6/PLAUR domain-containing protein-like n=1 Tax=Hyperolius riggenbachi TaxID=752182 RepID=UPI0035A34AB3
MTWPPQSPELNPLEMVWGELDRRVKAKGPTSAKHLWELLQDCWKTISDEPPRSYSSGCATKNVCGQARSMSVLPNVYSESNILCAPANSTDLKPGNFLWCLTCFSYTEDHCLGDEIMCSPGEDVCVREYLRTIHDGWDVTEITRRCGKSIECGRVGSIRSTEKTMLVNTSCCYGSNCEPPATTLPSISDEDNGLICPDCFAKKSDRCKHFNNIKCTGDETRCMSYVKTEKFVTESLHGCTTEKICEVGSRTVKLTGRYKKSIIHNITCNSSNTWRSAIYSLFILLVPVLCLMKACL